MEETGCEIICGAPQTLAVKGLMIMMMMMTAPPTLLHSPPHKTCIMSYVTTVIVLTAAGLLSPAVMEGTLDPVSKRHSCDSPSCN